VVPYTNTQKIELQKRLPLHLVMAAPNSLVRKVDCVVDDRSDPDARFEVLFIGRLTVEKKPLLLLEAFARARDRLPQHVRLAYVGAGPLGDRLRERAAELNLADRVELRGHVTNPVLLRRWYQSGVCAVSPGYVGLSAIQSFAHGVPMIIADREPHAPEIEACREGVNCVFFKAGDATALADAIVAMWQQRAGWHARRAQIASWVAENYSVEAMVDGFEAAMHQVQRVS
jgi:glycosyltransferase involved in cell wall biosynthesis